MDKTSDTRLGGGFLWRRLQQESRSRGERRRWGWSVSVRTYEIVEEQKVLVPGLKNKILELVCLVDRLLSMWEVLGLLLTRAYTRHSGTYLQSQHWGGEAGGSESQSFLAT